MRALFLCVDCDQIVSTIALELPAPSDARLRGHTEIEALKRSTLQRNRGKNPKVECRICARLREIGPSCVGTWVSLTVGGEAQRERLRAEPVLSADAAVG